MKFLPAQPKLTLEKAEQYVPAEEALPESLSGFDLAAGLERLQGISAFTKSC